MKSKQINFFATKNDLTPLAENIESAFELQYVEMGLFDESRIGKYTSFSAIPGVGLTKCHSSPTKDHRYMVVPRELAITVREVPLRKGGMKYAIDPMLNGSCVELSPGGIFVGKENVLILGRCGVVSSDDFSNRLYRKISLAIKRDFRKIGWVFVGKEAEEKLRIGWRLVRDEKLPRDMDLALDQL